MSNSKVIKILNKKKHPDDYCRLELHSVDRLDDMPVINERGREVCDIPLAALLQGHVDNVNQRVHKGDDILQAMLMAYPNLIEEMKGPEGWSVLRVVSRNAWALKNRKNKLSQIGYDAEKEFFSHPQGRAPTTLVQHLWGGHPLSFVYNYAALQIPHMFFETLDIADIEADSIVWEYESSDFGAKGIRDSQLGLLHHKRAWLVDVKSNRNNRFIKAENSPPNCNNFRGGRFNNCSWLNAHNRDIPYVIHHYLKNNSSATKVKFFEKSFDTQWLSDEWNNTINAHRFKNGHDYQTHDGTMAVP